jgi:hypothetical protein
MAAMGIFATIYSTRAMRQLKPDPIPEEILRRRVHHDGQRTEARA